MSVVRAALKRHEFLTEISEKVSAVLRRLKIDDALSDQAGDEVADYLSDSFGGQVMSFPKDKAFKVQKRRIEIMGRFNGFNHGALAREYGMTERAIYKIVADHHKQKINLAQLASRSEDLKHV